MKKLVLGKRIVALGAIFAVGYAFADPIQTFSSDPTLGTISASGVWYTDRYAPDGFESEYFDGDNRLLHSIDASDAANVRPSSFSDAFYNTQGRKYNVDTTYVSIDLWVPTVAYLDSNVGSRYAGFWGTAVNAGNSISGYPILEYRRQGVANNGAFGFSVWNGAGWFDLGAPTGFSNEAWYTLEMSMVGDNVTFSVGDLSHTVQYAGSIDFTNVILQGYNTTAGVTYDIYWDNLATEAPVVPVPAAAWMGFLGIGMIAARRRLKKA